MTQDQMLLIAILAATMAMFLWGRWRHDIVAMGSLLACILAGLVPAGDAFAGFGHPAVITVACVLILSRVLSATGAVDVMVKRILPRDMGFVLTIVSLSGVAAALSAFMNNVGALALLMPVALQIAARQGIAPGRVLMPLAFGSILGGMTTLIGTPPNLIVSGFREGAMGSHFAMFDFTPVGLAVALGGIAFIALIGWRLVPDRKRAGAEGFETSAYVTEARVAEDSKAVGMRLYDIERALDEADAQVLGMIRNEVLVRVPNMMRQVRVGDILLIEADHESLAPALATLNLKLEEAIKPEKPDTATAEDDENSAMEKTKEKSSSADEVSLAELAVLPGSELIGRSASDIRLRTLFGINLLAISREGTRTISRLRTTRLHAGDVLLIQGPAEAIYEFASQTGCVPLAERTLNLPNRREAILSAGVMGAAIAVTAFGLLPAATSFALGAFACLALRLISPRTVYDAVDWPVIVLLGALIPVAGAMPTTGTAELLAGFLFETLAQGNGVLALALILIVTMTLSDFMNNAATAAVMCPIAIGTAASLGASADAFLMAVAIGASCAFLTPIGHQNNTLILGPGGFRFGDYWRLGLPLEIIVVAIAVPLILIVWPL